MHFHRAVELVYHPRGSGVTTLQDGRQIVFERHGTVIYPAYLRHDQRMIDWGDDICLHIVEPSLEQTTFSEALYIPPSPRKVGQADRFVRTEFLHLARIRPSRERRWELDLRVTALVARLLQLKSSSAREISLNPSESHLDRACRFIGENFAQIKSANEVARHVGVSTDYLRHLFAAHGGTSINRLLNQTKIERVKELLVHSKLPIKAIASLAGFETERYLSTRFKNLTGCSPGVYRRQQAGREDYRPKGSAI